MENEPNLPVISDKFIEKVFEIAFGDNAINRGYTENDVLARLEEINIEGVNVYGED